MWKVNPQFFGRGPLMVAVVGVGGTGSEIISNLTHLHLALKALGYDGLHVVAFDPDRVSEANVVRQRYALADVGLYKTEVLIHRVNLTYAVRWEAVTTRFTGTHARTPGISLSPVLTHARRARNCINMHSVSDSGSGNGSSGSIAAMTPRSDRSSLARRAHPAIAYATICRVRRSFIPNLWTRPRIVPMTDRHAARLRRSKSKISW